MVSAATRRFADAVRSGRAEFRVGTVENMPLPDVAFEKALSVHTIYFWQSLRDGSAELARVLRPGGRVVLGFLPKAHMDQMNMPADIFTPREPGEVLAALQVGGFSDTEVRDRTREAHGSLEVCEDEPGGRSQRANRLASRPCSCNHKV
ncbi:class I SAM-dependent methyltransferase [Mesorhizobium australicum]|uniref:class I SAM-dependent methyltransferase n=1 Tax=Mesorhizobium australicum TaxID=536018 RepID=UPI00333C91BA